MTDEKCFYCKHDKSKHSGKCTAVIGGTGISAGCRCGYYMDFQAAKDAVARKRKKLEKSILSLARRRGDMFDSGKTVEAAEITSHLLAATVSYHKTIVRQSTLISRNKATEVESEAEKDARFLNSLATNVREQGGP